MEPKQQPPYPLRMPVEMRSHYEDLAQASKRSLNAEIVAGLQELQELRNKVESLRSELTELRRSASQREDVMGGALKSQQIVVMTLAQFIVTQGKLSTPETGTEEIHDHIQRTALAVSGGDSESAMASIHTLTPLLHAYVERKAAEAAGHSAPAKTTGRKPKP